MVPTVCARCRPLVAAARQLRLSTTTTRTTKTKIAAAAAGARRGYSSNTKSTSSDHDHKGKNVVIFSGIQPTGIPHIGNYLGAMKQWKRLQDIALPGDKLFWSIVDLHAITMPQDAEALRMRRREMLAALLAIGLDPEKSNLFYQSSVPQHTELMWILSCTASMGYLSRMTQWKAKLQEGGTQPELHRDVAEKLKLGLFSYPVLQAADILVHRTTHVPVGEDQTQHLEFARECATNFNYNFEKTLVQPKTITTSSPRIMALQNPHNKMSKSAPNKRSCIFITAEAAEIRQRIMTAVTDTDFGIVTWQPDERPGVANLLGLLAQCGDGAGEISPEALAKTFAGGSLLDLKLRVADAVVAELAGVRDRFFEIKDRRQGEYLAEVEAAGAAKARESAEETMKRVRDAVGLR